MEITFNDLSYSNIKNHKLQAFYYFSKNTQIDMDTRIKLLLDVSNYYKKYLSIEKFLFCLNEKMRDSPPIMIKGLSSYLLTKNPIFIRKCNDVDIISEDNSVLIKKLLEMGFVDTCDACDEHEEIKLYSKEYDLLVEVHKYFPVFSRNRGQNMLKKGQITYDIMKDNIYTYVSPTTNQRINILNLEMSIIITASHIYKGFVWQPLLKPVFRFEEVLEVYGLANHIDFNLEEFLLLLEKCNVIDSLSFVSELISSNIIGENPFGKLNLHYPPEYKIAGGYQNIWKEVNDAKFFSSIVNSSSFDYLFSTDCIDSIKPISNKWLHTRNFSSTIYISNSIDVHDFIFSITIEEEWVHFSVKKEMPVFNEDSVIIQFEYGFCKAILYEKTNKITQFGNGNIQLIKDNSFCIVEFSFLLSDFLKNDNIAKVIILSEINQPKAWRKTILPFIVKL